MYRKKIKKIYILCGALILGIVGLLFIYKSIHSKIDIYSMNFNYSNESNALNKAFTYNNQNVYYYGIENTFLCNQEQECFDLKEAIKNKRTSFSEIREYFKLKDGISLTSEMFSDGGTTIYQNNNFSVIFCNTLRENQDIYIGKREMIDALNGKFCDH